MNVNLLAVYVHYPVSKPAYEPPASYLECSVMASGPDMDAVDELRLTLHRNGAFIWSFQLKFLRML